ncbi:phosphonate ABC transporter ATP-binding protein [Phaeobacter sp. C3_T13_0]|uniref:phosphonate ABC transporter ATP-binding protein n=1 Tax=Phaeobacter cretensis TaxID=3342641 RepID=UPI0039BC270F
MQELLEAVRPPAQIKAAYRPATTPIIEVSDVGKIYGRGAPILDGVNLTVHEGERVALIGANGAGKSTLLKCLIGLHPTSNGTVSTLGERFEVIPSKVQRRRMRLETGFVFQKHCLVARRSVLSNVIHGFLGTVGSWRGFSHTTSPKAWREAAMRALEDVNLLDFALHRADELSGGQQQRVAIARALVRKPRLLIADEPAASLDPTSGRDVMELFSTLCKRQGITLLFTSHDMQHARSFADRVVALRNGRIFLDRPSADLTDRDLEETFNV